MDEERDKISAEETADEIEAVVEQPEELNAAEAEMPARQEDTELEGNELSTEEAVNLHVDADPELMEDAEGAPQMTLANETQLDELSEPQAVDTAMEPGEPDVAVTEASVAEGAANQIEAKAEDEMVADAELEPESVPEIAESIDEVAAEAEDEAAAIANLEPKANETMDEGPTLADEEIVAEAETEPEPEDGRAWYVVHCYSGYENKVRHNLEQRIESMGMKDQIFDVVVPTEEEIEVKEGKRRTVERRVFPGYILVNMIMGEEPWYVVRNTPGVTSFVGQGNEPLPLRPEEVSQIIKRMEADAPRIKVTFRSGERVRIVDGPFNDFRGTVSEIDMERAKVRVMVNFFGRETPVELDFLQVEKA